MSDTFESDFIPKVPTHEVNLLPDDLEKFDTTGLLGLATVEVIVALQDPDSDKAQQTRAWRVYAEIVEKTVESIIGSEDPTRFAYAQIMAILHKSLIFQQVGNTLRYL